MATTRYPLDQVVHRCRLEELRDAAQANGLPSAGRKAELVHRLCANLPPRKILDTLSNKELQRLLIAYELSRSGPHDDLVRRLLRIIEKPRVRSAGESGKRAKGEVSTAASKQTAIEKGTAFEKRVQTWLKKRLAYKDVQCKKKFKGKVPDYPHEVDIVIRAEDGSIMWVECKDRKVIVKRTDIGKFYDAAQDVKAASGLVGMARRYVEWPIKWEDWKYLLYVSTSRFDNDALKWASRYNIGCYEYDGGKFRTVNEIRGFRL